MGDEERQWEGRRNQAEVEAGNGESWSPAREGRRLDVLTAVPPEAPAQLGKGKPPLLEGRFQALSLNCTARAPIMITKTSKLTKSVNL